MHTKKISDIKKLTDAISEESIVLFLSKKSNLIPPDLYKMIHDNDFRYFKLFLNHDQSSYTTNNLRHNIFDKRTSNIECTYKIVIDELKTCLKEGKPQDNIIVFHLLGLLKYFKGYKDEYNKDFLKELSRSDYINDINKISATNSYLFINGSMDDNYLFDEISRFKNSINIESFFFNYLTYYYGSIKNTVKSLTTYLDKKYPVLHMIYVIGDMVDFGQLDKHLVLDLEKSLNKLDIDKSIMRETLDMYHKKTEITPIT